MTATLACCLLLFLFLAPLSALTRDKPQADYHEHLLSPAVSGVAGLGDWKSKKQLIASRIREVGIHRILFGSDSAWTNFTPLQAEVAFHELPLTREELLVIDNNVAPYIRMIRNQ